MKNIIAQPAAGNPLDLAEEFVAAHNWAFNRSDDDELLVEVQGHWTDYQLYFLWRPELGALYFSLSFDCKIPVAKKTQAYELLGRINEKLWLGHFDLINNDHTLLYRHTLLIRGMNGLTIEQLEDLVDSAVAETERFYPALQYFIWGGRSPEAALEAALFETVGDA